jgi:hypothetical protein
MGPAVARIPGQPVVVDLTKATKTRGTITLIIDAIAILTDLFYIAVEGFNVVNVLFLVLPVAVMVLIGVLWLGGFGAYRPRRLTIEPRGLRWEDKRGASWAVPWTELAATSIWTGVATNSAMTFHPSIANMRVQLYPRDPGFSARHPQLTPLWLPASNCYQVSLPANAAGAAGEMDWAMRQYSAGTYRGLVRGNTFR